MTPELTSWRSGPWEPAGGKAWGVSWGIVAPWAHPLWSQYELALYDLTTPLPGKKPTIKRPGMTHEFILWAIDPEKPLEVGKDIKLQAPGRYLEPPNHGYQFTADSNQAALARLQTVVDAIVVRQLSPDTDWRWQWDALFADGVTLRQRTPSWDQVRAALRQAYGADR